jgi:hypothetical protein
MLLLLSLDDLKFGEVEKVESMTAADVHGGECNLVN